MSTHQVYQFTQAHLEQRAESLWDAWSKEHFAKFPGVTIHQARVRFAAFVAERVLADAQEVKAEGQEQVRSALSKAVAAAHIRRDLAKRLENIDVKENWLPEAEAALADPQASPLITCDANAHPHQRTGCCTHVLVAKGASAAAKFASGILEPHNDLASGSEGQGIRSGADAGNSPEGASPAAGPAIGSDTCETPESCMLADRCLNESFECGAERSASPETPCPDCDEAARHANSGATTPGFFANKCAKHREPTAPSQQQIQNHGTPHGSSEVERLERNLEQAVTERDDFEEIISQLAVEAGCGEEWSNLHNHGVECIVNGFAANLAVVQQERDKLKIELEAAEAASAQARKDAFKEMEAWIQHKRECESNLCIHGHGWPDRCLERKPCNCGLTAAIEKAGGGK